MFDTDGRPLHVVWRYDRAELIADGIVHGIGVVFALCGGTALILLAALYAKASEFAAVTIYATGLLALLGVSAAYNLWPVSRTKWFLRRFDHALIFVLIAATYTPFATLLGDDGTRALLLGGIWSVAAAGAAMKIALPGRFDRLSVALYLLLGFSGLLAWDAVSASIPAPTLALVVTGGLVYAAGVVFHLWQTLRFQNAVWHAFVLVASVIFYSAILDGVVLA